MIDAGTVTLPPIKPIAAAAHSGIDFCRKNSNNQFTDKALKKA